uniref:Uncharacterized protein n=1 Tax=Craspedostauros australis TaxID=1486917 RepID=A0A7R9WQS7_9STRA|mmetsp:Transcript_14487/g.39937  ORF Transcript_14487/g.39937 Transcript_14487/m.39937 type:complete len:267 (+) Transcript_14487:197-997(+)
MNAAMNATSDVASRPRQNAMQYGEATAGAGPSFASQMSSPPAAASTQANPMMNSSKIRIPHDTLEYRVLADTISYLPRHAMHDARQEPTSATQYNLYREASLKTSSTDDMSLRDFREKDWTPQDSGYGAACPVCGWIPKPVRRAIEYTLIVGMVIFMVYIVVVASIQLKKERSQNESNVTSDNYDGGVQTDDDLYQEYSNDHYYQDDDAGYYGMNDNDSEYAAYSGNDDDDDDGAQQNQNSAYGYTGNANNAYAYANGEDNGYGNR